MRKILKISSIRTEINWLRSILLGLVEILVKDIPSLPWFRNCKKVQFGTITIRIHIEIWEFRGKKYKKYQLVKFLDIHAVITILRRKEDKGNIVEENWSHFCRTIWLILKKKIYRKSCSKEKRQTELKMSDSDSYKANKYKKIKYQELIVPKD